MRCRCMSAECRAAGSIVRVEPSPVSSALSATVDSVASARPTASQFGGTCETQVRGSRFVPRTDYPPHVAGATSEPPGGRDAADAHKGRSAWDRHAGSRSGPFRTSDRHSGRRQRLSRRLRAGVVRRAEAAVLERGIRARTDLCQYQSYAGTGSAEAVVRQQPLAPGRPQNQYDPTNFFRRNSNVEPKQA